MYGYLLGKFVVIPWWIVGAVLGLLVVIVASVVLASMPKK